LIVVLMALTALEMPTAAVGALLEPDLDVLVRVPRHGS
jgi:hypothetical protein